MPQPARAVLINQKNKRIALRPTVRLIKTTLASRDGEEPEFVWHLGPAAPRQKRLEPPARTHTHTTRRNKTANNKQQTTTRNTKVDAPEVRGEWPELLGCAVHCPRSRPPGWDPTGRMPAKQIPAK